SVEEPAGQLDECIPLAQASFAKHVIRNRQWHECSVTNRLGSAVLEANQGKFYLSLEEFTTMPHPSLAWISSTRREVSVPSTAPGSRGLPCSSVPPRARRRAVAATPGPPASPRIRALPAPAGHAARHPGAGGYP